LFDFLGPVRNEHDSERHARQLANQRHVPVEHGGPGVLGGGVRELRVHRHQSDVRVHDKEQHVDGQVYGEVEPVAPGQAVHQLATAPVVAPHGLDLLPLHRRRPFGRPPRRRNPVRSHGGRAAAVVSGGGQPAQPVDHVAARILGGRGHAHDRALDGYGHCGGGQAQEQHVRGPEPVGSGRHDGHRPGHRDDGGRCRVRSAHQQVRPSSLCRQPLAAASSEHVPHAVQQTGRPGLPVHRGHHNARRGLGHAGRGHDPLDGRRTLDRVTARPAADQRDAPPERRVEQQQQQRVVRQEPPVG